MVDYGSSYREQTKCWLMYYPSSLMFVILFSLQTDVKWTTNWHLNSLLPEIVLLHWYFSYFHIWDVSKRRVYTISVGSIRGIRSSPTWTLRTWCKSSDAFASEYRLGPKVEIGARGYSLSPGVILIWQWDKNLGHWYGFCRHLHFFLSIPPSLLLTCCGHPPDWRWGVDSGISIMWALLRSKAVERRLQS